jgi:hypothetical protein
MADYVQSKYNQYSNQNINSNNVNNSENAQFSFRPSSQENYSYMKT